jgi:glycosyltransferase involved in cell wall biosynthesis
MRIGFDGRSLESPAGGVRRYAGELVRALLRVNPSDTIVVFGALEATLPGAVQRLAVKQIFPTNLGWSLMDLPRVARREPIDVFHAPAYTAPLRGVHPLVLTIHDVSYERHPEWYPYRRDRLRRWFYRQSAKTADVIITDSEFSRHEISTAYDLDPDQISVVPLGVGAPFGGSAAHRLPQGVTGPYLLHVGDLHPRRNLRMLVRALGRLASSSANRAAPMLVLAGVDRGERAALEEEARHAHLRIDFIGVVDDQTLSALYAGAAAFVYPSRYEGFGLPLLEAMACGAPVLAARAGAIPEVVGDAGILVDPDDEAGMAAGIDRLINDAALSDRMRRAGRHRAKEYTWDRTAILTTQAYRAAVSRWTGRLELKPPGGYKWGGGR